MNELREKILVETTMKMIDVIGDKIDGNTGTVTLDGSEVAELCAGVVSVALRIFVEEMRTVDKKTMVYDISNN